MKNDLNNFFYLPNISDIYDFAYESLQILPYPFRVNLKNFIIDVQNFAEPEILLELSIKDKYDLLGLYKGVPVTLKKKKSNKLPDKIYLYRGPLIRHAMENEEKIKSLIYHVLINEIGYHIGYTPHEIDKINKNIKFSPQK